MKINTRSPFYKQYTGTISIDTEFGQEEDGVVIQNVVTVDSTLDQYKVSNNFRVGDYANT